MGAAVRVAGGGGVGEVENARERSKEGQRRNVPCLLLSVVQRARVSVASVV